jgi:hypothetical protein
MEEVKHAEPLFVSTVSDFAGRVNEHKTEGFRVCDMARAPCDFRVSRLSLTPTDSLKDEPSF